MRIFRFGVLGIGGQILGWPNTNMFISMCVHCWDVEEEHFL